MLHLRPIRSATAADLNATDVAGSGQMTGENVKVVFHGAVAAAVHRPTRFTRWRASGRHTRWVPLLSLALLLSLLPPANAQTTAQIAPPRTAESRRFMVVAVSPPAVEAGAAVLREGGTAVDAAVTVALAMAVTWPPAGNIGGGGFMMVAPADGRPPVCIDYREMAPAAASATMFELGESRFTRKIVGVPGTLRGLELAHRKYGKLPWRRLVQPAVDLAADGFPVSSALAESLTAVWRDEATLSLSEFRRVFAPPDGQAWKAGDKLVQPDLARTMQFIRELGADAMYDGPVGDLLVAEMQQHGGLISTADLRAYRAIERAPIRTSFRGHIVLGPPPPSSGGIAVSQMLNILQNFDLRSLSAESPEARHLIIEAMRRAYLDRARYVGDPAFTEIPPRLTTPAYATELARGISVDKATDSLSLAPELDIVTEGDSTTHFSIVDGSGMAVSNTYTLEYSYGSRVVVTDGGFLLNNEMGDFNWKPGHTDARGNIGTAANLVAPHKRMLSSQTPTIVLRDGKPVIVTGSPGGRTIINTVMHVLLNRLEFQMTPEDSVRSARFHHQWLPDRVRYEDWGGDGLAVRKQLESRGHRFDESPTRQGDAHSIFVDWPAGTMTGVADGRILGAARGE